MGVPEKLHLNNLLISHIKASRLSFFDQCLAAVYRSEKINPVYLCAQIFR
jgi:hypothetical protein